MIGQLERRAEAISGEFKSQEVAHTLETLWAICFLHDMRVNAKSARGCGKVDSGLRRALSFFDVQVEGVFKGQIAHFKASAKSVVTNGETINAPKG